MIGRQSLSMYVFFLVSARRRRYTPNQFKFQVAVLLNANIAFLAIPETSSGSTSTAPTQSTASPSSSTASFASTSDQVQAIIVIASQVSMMLSLSSMIVGLSLLKQSGSARAHSENELVSITY